MIEEKGSECESRCFLSILRNVFIICQQFMLSKGVIDFPECAKIHIVHIPVPVVWVCYLQRQLASKVRCYSRVMVIKGAPASLLSPTNDKDSHTVGNTGIVVRQLR